jgi:hypothetical protein
MLCAGDIVAALGTPAQREAFQALLSPNGFDEAYTAPVLVASAEDGG